MPRKHSPSDEGTDRDDRALIDVARGQVEDALEREKQRDRTPPTHTAQQGEPSFDGPPSDSFTGYQIIDEIHRGGQGVVYKALQESTKRKVAIKVMKEGPFAGSSEKARFEREVQILGQLKHPNIVAIHDTGVAAGCDYFVMDYISGRTLDVYLAAEERSIEETLELFGKICEAVNAAHLHGVIHRDLKPGNIRVDPSGEPHILDFGLAKVAAGGVSAMTMTGQFVGSLPWASPEQAEAVPSKVDVRTDVYSLGVILYQMLTGKFPYDVIGNMRDVLDRIMKAEPARPSTIRRQINDEVETIVLKCLSKERERRYQSAGELARDIGHYLNGEPIEAKRDSLGYVLRKHALKHRRALAIASLFTATLLAVFVFAWSARQAFRNDRFNNLMRQVEFGLYARQFEIAEQFAEQAQAYQSGPRELAELGLWRGWIRREMGSAAEAEAFARESLDQYRQAARLGHISPQMVDIPLADAQALLGLALFDQGKLAPAEAVLRECLAIRANQMPEYWATGNAMCMLGAVLAAQHRFTEAESLLLEGIERMYLPEPFRTRNREAVAYIVTLYDAWHAAEPDKGYAVRAADWRAKLPPSAATQRDPDVDRTSTAPTSQPAVGIHRPSENP